MIDPKLELDRLVGDMARLYYGQAQKTVGSVTSIDPNWRAPQSMVARYLVLKEQVNVQQEVG